MYPAFEWAREFREQFLKELEKSSGS